METNGQKGTFDNPKVLALKCPEAREKKYVEDDAFLGQFELTATIAPATVELCDGQTQEISPCDQLAAFGSEGQVRGVAFQTDGFSFGILGEVDEEITFKYYNTKLQQEFDVDFVYVFESNGAIGSIEAPKVLALKCPEACEKKYVEDDAFLGQFEFTANIIPATVALCDGQTQENSPCDQLAAFGSEGKVRGVASQITQGFSLAILGEVGEEITFKYWDSELKKEFVVDFKYTLVASESLASFNTRPCSSDEFCPGPKVLALKCPEACEKKYVQDDAFLGQFEDFASISPATVALCDGQTQEISPCDQ